MITPESRQLLKEAMGDREWKGLRVLELGDQLLWPEGTPAKEWFVSQGARHVSIDLNGRHGAVPLDLSMPIVDPEGFDVVTDFGTSEHVADLYQCWLNIHNLCKVGGLIIHAIPKVGSWPDHGFHYVTMESFKWLSKETGCRIVLLRDWPNLGNVMDGWLIHAVLQKQSVAFPIRRQFERMPLFSNPLTCRKLSQLEDDHE
jgi:hypothetical protein